MKRYDYHREFSGKMNKDLYYIWLEIYYDKAILKGIVKIIRSISYCGTKLNYLKYTCCEKKRTIGKVTNFE